MNHLPRRRSTPGYSGFTALAVVLASLVAAPAAAVEEIDQFRTKVEQWVETRQILSEEKSDWEADHELLRATRDLLRSQKSALREEIQALEATVTEADEERVALLLARGEFKRSTTAMEGWLAELEASVKGLLPRFPAPLQDKLEPLVIQIPDDPEEGRIGLGQRLVNVLGVILQSEKFDSTATLTGETRSVREGDDQKVQVRTLYWGLSQAVYVDAHGKAAGVGQPGPDGWEFVEDRDLADEARALLDIYEGNVDEIRFVQIPVEVAR